MKKQLKVPKFKNENKERDFWSKINLADYLELSDFTSVNFSDLKPTSHSISVRIPSYLLTRLKEKANELNIPYQSLMKQYIANGVLRDKDRKNIYQAVSKPKLKKCSHLN